MTGSSTGRLLSLDNIRAFERVKGTPADSLNEKVVATVRVLDEKLELEPYIRSILVDANATPHGPAEVADIITPKLAVDAKSVLSAWILKGKSFGTVRPKDVSHQIYRLEKIADLGLAVFAYTGNVLDAAVEQFISTAKRLMCSYVILDAVEIGRLLVAYGYLCPRDGSRITSGRCECGYASEFSPPNILQLEAHGALIEAHSVGQAGGLLVLPTGAGKTRLAAEDAYRSNPSRVLYVAHRQEILDVAQDEFEHVFSGREVVRHTTGSSLLKPGRVNLATIQLLRENLDVVADLGIDYLIVDEFHHAAADSYRSLLHHTNPEFLLGLTATPFRSDQQDILQLCHDNVIVSLDLRRGIEAGVLSPYHYYGCFDDVDYSNIRHNGREYNVRDLERFLIIPERDQAIIEKREELARGKPTLAFCISHRHAQRMAERFNQCGVSAAPYISSTPRAEREDLVDRHRRGELQVLCSVDVLNEGVDLPHVECLMFLRPTESRLLFYQQLGRGLRRHVGKPRCVVVDFIGNFKNAYRVVEYQSLDPAEGESDDERFVKPWDPKSILNLPVGCSVSFDDKVVDIFVEQITDARYANRRNIARILYFEYCRLWRRLGKRPSKKDVDRNCILDSRLYELVYRTWREFEDLVENENPLVGRGGR